MVLLLRPQFASSESQVVSHHVDGDLGALVRVEAGSGLRQRPFSRSAAIALAPTGVLRALAIGTTVKTSVHILLSEISPLLREVSEVMRTTSETRLARRLDEAALEIEGIMQSGPNDRTTVVEVLEITGQCIALIPEIAELLKLFKG